MAVHSVLDIFGLVILLAIIYQIARNAKGVGTLIGSTGQAFSGSIRAATGR